MDDLLTEENLVDMFAVHGNFLPIVEEVAENMLYMSTRTLFVMTDYSCASDLVRVTLTVRIKGITPEEALSNWIEYDYQKILRLMFPNNRLSWFDKQKYDPGDLSTEIEQLTGGDPTLIADFYDECFDEVWKPFDVSLPNELILDVRMGKFDPGKWETLARRYNLRYRSDWGPDVPLEDQHFEMRWSYPNFTEHSNFKFYVLIEPKGGGVLGVHFSSTEKNGDEFYINISETVFYSPPPSGEPLRMILVDDWGEFHNMEIPPSSVVVFNGSALELDGLDETYFAETFL